MYGSGQPYVCVYAYAAGAAGPPCRRRQRSKQQGENCTGNGQGGQRGKTCCRDAEGSSQTERGVCVNVCDDVRVALQVQEPGAFVQVPCICVGR